MSQIWVNQVTRKNESFITSTQMPKFMSWSITNMFEWVMSPKSCRKEEFRDKYAYVSSYHTDDWVIVHKQMGWVVSKIYECIISHLCMTENSRFTDDSWIVNGLVSSFCFKFLKLFDIIAQSTSADVWNTLGALKTLYNTLQHNATHCNTLQHTATHCNTLQHTAPQHTLKCLLRWCHYNILQKTATHCNTLQHTTTHCNTLQRTARQHTSTYFCRRCALQHTATHWYTQQYNTTHYHTLQHTATHCNILHHDTR